MQNEITEQIVAFLNGCGGVLLIGCKKGKMGGIYPDVEDLTENQKEVIATRLQNYISTIYPLVSLNRQIDYKFIPVGNYFF